MWTANIFLYDIIDLTRLAVEAMRMGYLVTILFMLPQLYIAMRVVVLDQCLAAGGVAGNGVVPGCQEAGNIARIIVRCIVGVCRKEHRIISIRTYVDDFALRGEGTLQALLSRMTRPSSASSPRCRMQGCLSRRSRPS